MNDEKIIELYWRRDEQAIRESITAYGAYCRKIATEILPDPADVDEALADTWIAAWDCIPPQRPEHLRLFLGRIARNCAIGIWRKNNAKSRGGGQVALALEELGECISSGDSTEAVFNARELERKITAFLKGQPTAGRQVFVRRYFYLEDTAAIASRYGLRESNVRMTLSRTRQKLRKYLEQEGYKL